MGYCAQYKGLKYKKLNTRDSKLKFIWSKMNWKGNISNEHSGSPDLKDLCNHFKAKSQTTDDSTLLCEFTSDNYVDVLDKRIESEEIQKPSDSLKEDKVSGDGWTNECSPVHRCQFCTLYKSSLM